MSDLQQPIVSNETPDLPRWYFRVDENVRGPFTLSEMAKFVRSGDIGPHDEIWLSSSPRWILAERVALLFRLAGCTPETAPKQPRGARRPNILDLAVSALCRSASNGVGAFSSSFFWGWNRFTSLFASIRFVPGVLFVAVICSSALFWFRPKVEFIENLTYPPRERAFDFYESVWDEVTDLRQRDANRDEWDQLISRVDREAKPLLAQLRKTAGASDRAAQQLLWAGRDCLLPLLALRGTLDEELSKSFEEHMENAHKVIQGERLDFGAPGWRKSRRNTQPERPPPWRPGLTELILAVDAAIVMWLLWMGFKRFRVDSRCAI